LRLQHALWKSYLELMLVCMAGVARSRTAAWHGVRA
jgi:hypothetical protein